MRLENRKKGCEVWFSTCDCFVPFQNRTESIGSLRNHTEVRGEPGLKTPVLGCWGQLKRQTNNVITHSAFCISDWCICICIAGWIVTLKTSAAATRSFLLTPFGSPRQPSSQAHARKGI